jgi:hypothetical protein
MRPDRHASGGERCSSHAVYPAAGSVNRSAKSPLFVIALRSQSPVQHPRLRRIMAGTTDRPAADEAVQPEHRLELRQEALTTALYAVIVLVIAVAVAALKNFLAGH